MWTGQTVSNLRGGVIQEHLNEWATEECKCAAGEYDRKMKKSYEKAVKNIEKLFDNDFPETAEILKTALPFIMKDDIAGITIKTGHEVDAKLSMTSKGKVKVEKKNNKKISITE